MATYSRDWMVNAHCRTDPDPSKWQADNRGDGQSIDNIVACAPCSSHVECARYALRKNEPNEGMVWAGVGVPEMTRFREPALRRLRVIAGYPPKPIIKENNGTRQHTT